MFVLAAQTPVLGYNTRLDDFMALSYITVFCVVLYVTHSKIYRHSALVFIIYMTQLLLPPHQEGARN
jgi:hypothetical protein